MSPSGRPLQETPPRPTAPVLPRPNRGPEPWRDDASPWLAPALVAIAALTILAALLRRRRPPTADVPSLRPADDSDEARLLALCDGLRAALTSRLGPSLRARTTEEVAADPRVAEVLGGDLAGLSEILAAGDRVKFAGREAVAGLADRLPEWAGRAGSLEATIRRPPPTGRRPDSRGGVG